MNLHEFQAKQLFSSYGIPISAGDIADSVEHACAIAFQMGGDRWVVKAQVHAGGRGKGGGVKLVQGEQELRQAVSTMLGSRLVTSQTTLIGLPVRHVLIEPAVEIVQQLYLGAVIDRASERVVFMASELGGMDIERLVTTQPNKMYILTVDPIGGLHPYQWRRVGFALGLKLDHFKTLGRIMDGLYRLFMEKDASLAEINPLVLTAEGNLLAIDAKMVLDDNALFRHPEFAAYKDPSQENEREVAAQERGLNYIALDGNIGCMVNGAGLAMATMDIIKLHGGEPANFLDVGGAATAERVAEAFTLILSDPKVRAVLVNIFGGIVRCDLIAEGIIKSVAKARVSVPVVVRLEGTNAERGKAMLRGNSSALTIIQAAEDFTDAAKKVVALAATETH